MHQLAGVRVDLLPEANHGHRAVAGDRQPEQRVVALVQQRPQAWQARQLAEGGEQIVPITLAGMGAEVALVPIPRQSAPRRVGGGEPGSLDERVVFQKANEHPISNQCAAAWVTASALKSCRVSAVREASFAARHSPLSEASRSGVAAIRSRRSASRMAVRRLRPLSSAGAEIMGERS
ncbi:MAG: hypothetical protein WAV07_15990 [Candidatus Contendobacter sp.]